MNEEYKRAKIGLRPYLLYRSVTTYLSLIIFSDKKSVLVRMYESLRIF